MPQKVKINRDDRLPMYLSDKVKAPMVPVVVPNGRAWDDGEEPGQMFEQGARSGMMSTYARKLFGGNRTGE